MYFKGLNLCNIFSCCAPDLYFLPFISWFNSDTNKKRCVSCYTATQTRGSGEREQTTVPDMRLLKPSALLSLQLKMDEACPNKKK